MAKRSQPAPGVVTDYLEFPFPMQEINMAVRYTSNHLEYIVACQLDWVPIRPLQ